MVDTSTIILVETKVLVVRQMVETNQLLSFQDLMAKCQGLQQQMQALVASSRTLSLEECSFFYLLVMFFALKQALVGYLVCVCYMYIYYDMYIYIHKLL